MWIWGLMKNAVLTVLGSMLNINRESCFEGLGCYNNSAPFNNAGGLVPSISPPLEKKVHFLLYTRKDGDGTELLDNDTSAIWDSNFNAKEDTKLLVHGYHWNIDQQWMANLTKILLEKFNYNVIVIDWRGCSNIDNYNQVVANARVVGDLAARLMETLHNVTGANYSRMHIIGHSLGAHVAGYAGTVIPGLGRISGLDPAGPGFENTAPEVRLDPTDAIFVDVIHTNAQPLLKLGFGLEQQIGDVDFYPNGGREQPGCENKGINIAMLFQGRENKIASEIGCSHLRVVNLYIESVTCSFLAYPCPSTDAFRSGKCPCHENCTQMGFHAADRKSLPGRYELVTDSEPPYCMRNASHKHVTPQHSTSSHQTTTRTP